MTIPVDPRFHSLNLAQAVAITAYEWRLTRAAGPPPRFTAAPAPADQAAVHGFYDQLEGELEAAGFFHPPEKRASMVRNLRVAFGRANLSEQEVRTLRGVVTALSKGRGRVLAKLAAAPPPPLRGPPPPGGEERRISLPPLGGVRPKAGRGADLASRWPGSLTYARPPVICRPFLARGLTSDGTMNL